MATAPTLPLEILFSVADQLSGEGDLLNLGLTQQALTEHCIRTAVKVALIGVPFDGDLKPFTYAIKHGDTKLLSELLRFLDRHFPAGWKWTQFFTEGASGLLNLAAASNLEALRYLVEKYPLIPAPPWETRDQVPYPVPEHGFYSHLGDKGFTYLVEIRNCNLVMSALREQRYDCASFLLNYQPSLFPDGFPADGDPDCYSSPELLNFLIDYGADLGEYPLHEVACFDIPDCRVFDILVQKGFGVDTTWEPFDPPSRENQIFTPLQAACRALQPRNAEALLRLGANPNGVTSSILIEKLRRTHGFDYFSPAPILALLLSVFWDIPVRGDVGAFARALADCFQSLIRYGATTNRNTLLQILLLRIWRVLYEQVTEQTSMVLPICPDKPGDLNPGVQSLFLAYSRLDVSPWDHVCQVFSDTNAAQTGGNGGLIKLLNEYQDEFGDLPGPAQLEQPSLFSLPDRYGAQLFIREQ